MNAPRRIMIAIGLAASLVLLLWFGSRQQQSDTMLPPAPPSSHASIPEMIKQTYKPTGVFAATFGTYKEEPVTIQPSVPTYTVDAKLKNVSNLAQFTLSDEAKKKLTQNAFVVTPGYNREFYPMYENNRYNYIPNFVTADSILHNYHLVFDHLLKQVEEQYLASELKQLSAAMLTESISQYNALKETAWERAAKRNVGFFTVGSSLLDPATVVPSIVKTEVQRELAMIEAHQGISASPVMNIDTPQGTMIDTPQGSLPLEGNNEDYSQYIPRGHYTKTDLLRAYFKAMMWYGRLTFRLKNPDEIKSGILITLALNQDNNRVGWNGLYEPINFFVGKSDDITYYQFSDLMKKAYGDTAALTHIASDTPSFDVFVAATKQLAPPQLNSIPIFNKAIQPDREKEIKGFRFLGQRFTIDASIFQRLIDRETQGRMLPKALDIPAALQSNEALKILQGLGETTTYPDYSPNMTKLQAHLAGLPTTTWTQNLYWGWLYAIRPLLATASSGYPTFMHSSAWARKDLNSFVGSWTELKHDTILYAKQVYAEMGGGGEEIKKWDDRGYVEPVPMVYTRLASLLRLTSDGLESRNLLDAGAKESIEKMRQLVLSLKTISEKELANKTLTDAEYELIRSYGGQLEHFWLDVNQEDMDAQHMAQRDFLDQNPAAIVADVATDPNGSVLEEGTGAINQIYVVVPIDGKLKITTGGVYSTYEFKQPLADRLTDEKWRDMLDTSQAPAMPSWTDAFMVK